MYNKHNKTQNYIILHSYDIPAADCFPTVQNIHCI